MNLYVSRNRVPEKSKFIAKSHKCILGKRKRKSAMAHPSIFEFESTRVCFNVALRAQHEMQLIKLLPFKAVTFHFLFLFSFF